LHTVLNCVRCAAVIAVGRNTVCTRFALAPPGAVTTAEIWNRALAGSAGGNVGVGVGVGVGDAIGDADALGEEPDPPEDE
jgi:hypothetical protein